jgi:arylsulfatase A-like enzyme
VTFRPIHFLIWALLFVQTAFGKPPNVVMIISDDQAWTDYGFMGHPHIQTPHLDRLAREGLTFRRGYVPSSLCCPSLASLITGRYPHQHRVVGNDPPRPPGMKAKAFYKSQEFARGREVMTRHLNEWPLLTRVLGDAGYLSLQTGKWWLGHYSSGGFSEGMTKGGRHGDDGLEIGRTTMLPIEDFIVRSKKEEKPFFIWYAPLLPHDPHKPPERILAKYRDKTSSIRVARYWAMCEWFDETCGQVLDLLEREGLAENTIVTYLSDNGWIQDPDSNQYAPRSKQSPYDGGLRTPIIIRWPDKIRPQMSDSAVSSLDLFPTVLKACQVAVPNDLPGIDVLDAGAVLQRKSIFGECFTHDFVDLEKPAASLRWRWVIEEGWKLIVPAKPNETGEPELYRISEDPNEAKDIASEEPEKVASLTRKLDGWWKP